MAGKGWTEMQDSEAREINIEVALFAVKLN